MLLTSAVHGGSVMLHASASRYSPLAVNDEDEDDRSASHAPQPPLLSGVDVSSQLSAVCREHAQLDAVAFHSGLAAAALLAAAAAPA